MRASVYGIAYEGWIVVLLFAAAAVLAAARVSHGAALLPALLCVLAAVKFRDPERAVPADPLGVLSPVDGTVADIDEGSDGTRVLLRVAAFGSYLLRSPVEGRILESEHGLRIRTDEGDEIGMRLAGPHWLPSAAVVGYGERIGQGQRCGLLRTARIAELWLPDDARVMVERGAAVRAGETVLAHFHAEAPPEEFPTA